MEPEVQKALLQLVQEAKGMAAKEIPLVLHDLLIKGVVENFVLLGVGICLSFILFKLMRHMRKVNELEDTWGTDKDFMQFLTGIGIAATGVGTLLCIGGSLTELFTIWLAPRAYLLGLLK